MTSTQELAGRAAEELDAACFWMRGITPRSWIQVPDPPRWTHQALKGTPADAIRFALGSDGAGGRFNSEARLRRTTFASVVVAETPRGYVLRNATAGVTRGAQTVPNAELQGARHAHRIAGLQ